MRLEGERVRLEPVQPGHTDLIVKWRSDPVVVQQMFSDRAPSADEHRRWLRRIRREGTREEFIISLSDGNRPIGTIGLSAIERPHRRAEYGILIGERDAEGKGYAREASEIILAYGFRALDLHRIYLQVFEGNVRGIGLYERLGFQREGVMREAAWKAGRPLNIVIMAILRREWVVQRRGRSQ